MTILHTISALGAVLATLSIFGCGGDESGSGGADVFVLESDLGGETSLYMGVVGIE